MEALGSGMVGDECEDEGVWAEEGSAAVIT